MPEKTSVLAEDEAVVVRAEVAQSIFEADGYEVGPVRESQIRLVPDAPVLTIHFGDDRCAVKVQL